MSDDNTNRRSKGRLRESLSKSALNNLRSYFNMKVQKADPGSRSDDQTLVPAEKDKEGRNRSVPFPGDLKKIYNWWLNENHDSADTLKNRQDRYEDLEYMVYNDTAISMAAELYADEATQADEQDQVIGVEAPDKKVREEIYKLLSKWGFDKTRIRNDAYNLALYGDSFAVNSMKTNGIETSTPIDVKWLLERIEFNAIEAQEKMQSSAYRTLVGREKRLQRLVQAMQDAKQEDYSAFFKSYLFGFQLTGDIVLPPWNVTHFRLFSSQSEFYPYGRSLFINAISPFRQLKASKNMMALARAAKFPKEKFEVNTSDNMTQTQKWDAVNESREEYQNLGLTNQQGDEFAVGGQLWLPSDLIDYDTIESQISMDDIADVEMLRDDMIIATRVPKGYLIVDRASFGTSGQALLQQFKPFGRAVYAVQSAILREITQMIKVHFLVTGQFQKEYTDFELYMNFPVVEESQDRLSMKSDTLRLASDVISNVQDALGTRDGLPPDVIKAVFSKLTFLEPDDVDKWIQQSADAVLGEDNKRAVNNKLTESDSKKFLNRLDEDIIRSCYFRAMRDNNLEEGVFNKKHYVTSSNTDEIKRQTFEMLRTKPDDSEIRG